MVEKLNIKKTKLLWSVIRPPWGRGGWWMRCCWGTPSWRRRGRRASWWNAPWGSAAPWTRCWGGHGWVRYSNQGSPSKILHFWIPHLLRTFYILSYISTLQGSYTFSPMIFNDFYLIFHDQKHDSFSAVPLKMVYFNMERENKFWNMLCLSKTNQIGLLASTG